MPNLTTKMRPKSVPNDSNLIATFLRDVKPFLTTTNITAEVDNFAIRVDGLRDVNGATTFYIVQHQVTNTTNSDK